MNTFRQDRSQQSEVHLDTFEQMLASKLCMENGRMDLERRAALNRTRQTVAVYQYGGQYWTPAIL